LKILFLVTEDWFFWGHRLRIAQTLRGTGIEVLVMTHLSQLRGAMEKEGFRVVPWRISRGSLNPFRELYALLQVIAVYRTEKPDLVHHVALKPILYGGVAARLCGRPKSVNAVAGLGHVFTTSSWKMRQLRRLVLASLRWILKSDNTKTIFENYDHQNLLLNGGIVSSHQTLVIRGVGVNTKEFLPHSEPNGLPVVMLAARMLWEKGVGEFVTAASLLREQGVSARFVLVGKPDLDNPTSIPEKQLRAWVESGVVEWWGHRNDMPAVLAQSNLVCFPSHGEGLPTILIEAAACGRAIVCTDVPGCREVVRHDDNGLLVPVRDAPALARALNTLIINRGLRSRMGARGREIAVREFAVEFFLAGMMAVYRELLGPRWLNPASAVPSRSGANSSCLASHE